MLDLIHDKLAGVYVIHKIFRHKNINLIDIHNLDFPIFTASILSEVFKSNLWISQHLNPKHLSIHL